MNKIDRRGFLKALGVFLAGLALPKFLNPQGQNNAARPTTKLREARHYKTTDHLAG